MSSQHRIQNELENQLYFDLFINEYVIFDSLVLIRLDPNNNPLKENELTVESFKSRASYTSRPI